MPAIPILPGVYIAETVSSAHVVAPVATAITAFLGSAPSGPVDEPVRIAGFADYERRFGGLDAGSELGYGVREFFRNGGTQAWIVRAGDGRAPAQAIETSLGALDSVELFNLLLLPGMTEPRVLASAAAYCAARRAFLIVDAPRSAATPAEIAAWVGGTDVPKVNHAAVYYPWLRVDDPLGGGTPRLVAPSGTVAGLYARTDAASGVWHAPAGLAAGLPHVQALARVLTDLENASLNALGVNCIRSFPGHGAVVWGARTLGGADLTPSDFRYVPTQRLALLIEQSIAHGTRWAAFEPNGEALWARLRLEIGAFLAGLFARGAFQGKTPREAYFVQCDGKTTSATDMSQGVVHISVSFAPLRPAEFVRLRLQQRAGAPAEKGPPTP